MQGHMRGKILPPDLHSGRMKPQGLSAFREEHWEFSIAKPACYKRPTSEKGNKRPSLVALELVQGVGLAVISRHQESLAVKSVVVPGH